MTVSDSTIMGMEGTGSLRRQTGFPLTVQAELLKLPSAYPMKVYRFISE